MGDHCFGGFIEGIACFQRFFRCSFYLKTYRAGYDVTDDGAGMFMQGAFLSRCEIDLPYIDPGDGPAIELGEHQLFAYDGGLCAGYDGLNQEKGGQQGDQVLAFHRLVSFG